MQVLFCFLVVCYKIPFFHLTFSTKKQRKNISYAEPLYAFLHDLFLYDWHEDDPTHRLHGFTHPLTASKNAKELCNVDDEVIKIIKSHMWPLTITRVPKSREAFLVCMIDKIIATKEVIDNLKNVHKENKVISKQYNRV